MIKNKKIDVYSINLEKILSEPSLDIKIKYNSDTIQNNY